MGYLSLEGTALLRESHMSDPVEFDPPKQAAPGVTAQGPSGSASGQDEPSRPSLVDALVELIQTVVDYLRQEAEALVKDKVVMPTQKAGQVVAFALAAAAVLVLGLAFLSVGLLLVLANALGWPGALFLIGGVLVLGAGLLTFLKMKRIQR